MNERLKAIRASLKLSQSKFAEEMFVTRDVISNYEIGRVQPTDLFISTLCEKYRINEDWLRTGEGEMKVPASRESEIAEITATMFKSVETDIRYQLMRIVSQMTEEQLETFRDVAKQLVENTEVK
jgi:transcriptional regulator with XRE-family HTH domain